MLRAILFDFDGLILDTESPDYYWWAEVFEQHGCRLDLADWREGIGRGADGIAWNPYDGLEAQLGRAVDREEIRARRREHCMTLMEKCALPGVVELLLEARREGLKVGIASSSPHRWVDSHLEVLGILDLFDAVICAEDVARTKPDPELYVRLLEALGVMALESIALEDSPNGILAAKRAGICCIAVPNAMTHDLCFDHADLRIQSLVGISISDVARLLGARR